MQRRLGLVQVYTGNGKGKTTAALGLALRAWGHGLRVVIIQFLKVPDAGEHRALARLSPGIEVKAFGRKGIVLAGEVTDEDYRLARRGLEFAREVITAGMADLLILDEVNNALGLGLLTVPEVLALLQARPRNMEVVLTGRGAPPEIVSRADLVSEIQEVKHPYRTGVGGRPGIEF